MELAILGINQQEYEDTRLILEARSRILEENAFRRVLEDRELVGLGINYQEYEDTRLILAILGINQQEYEDTRLILEARSCILEENAFR